MKGYEALIVVNVLIFILSAFFNVMYGHLDALFGLIPHKVLDGEIYRLFTNIFLHNGLAHIVMNMLALFFFGMYLEEIIGTKKFLTSYFAGGISGSLWVMLFSISPFSVTPGLGISQNVIVVGASGAIFAIGTILALLAPNIRVGFLFFPIQTTLFYSIILWFIFLTLISFTGAHIANAGHLGGIIGGLIIGKFLRKQREIY